MKEMLIIFGIIVVPLFLIGLFAVYKGRKAEQKEQALEAGLYGK
ncbi:hypothetical protein FACS189479_02580 [Spirochaetia bacterium]|nr:hypothetical protein FACS1894110_06700 [Spirochaetia bacterium]GHU92747.1 hypothetical protein FACS189479_02580 [Spirochaetia bacterium]